MPSTMTKIKDALTGHSDNQTTTQHDNTYTHPSTSTSSIHQQHSSAAPLSSSDNKLAHAKQEFNDVTGSQSVASTREVPTTHGAGLVGSSHTSGSTSAVGVHTGTGQTHSTHITPQVGSSHGHIGGVIPDNNHLTKETVTSTSNPLGTVGTSWRHESHVLTNTMTGLQASPNIPNINTSEIYKDYLPNRNNQWIQSLIQKMDSASIDIDKYAKAQQELVSREASIEVERIMQSNKVRQDTLISSMHKRANEFEVEYSRKREALIKQLDKEESVLLERLQQQLKVEQEQIAQQTREQVEEVARLARDRKMAILGEAQQKQNQLSQTVTTTTTTEVDPTSLTKHHLYGDSKGVSTLNDKDVLVSGGEPRMSKNTTTTTTSTGTA